ncbi:hypothetical protein [Isoptericola variabilis]|uniref:Uncharacterized protein n=1 Tax=Isoptericola variabilis (strain 225) TaxID=743718 RepID=F6FT09_ISOV2|nr:hypothetical protein [Isoptericola variabilis]AEG44080.1 hypothetical protein Isova_1312 [Isoptericola variabilis 225]TWH27164.1 hypothetical protein L600_005000000080 [Isoptericola variabilis J7]TWH28769.1 hypothetical protein L600_003800000030 [Isoptericola variabilis J7]
MSGSPSSTPPSHGRGATAHPVARAWRWVAAVGVLVSAVVHLVLWVHGYADIPVVGPLFLLNALGGAVLSVLLVAWRHWLPLVGGIGFGAATLVAFVLSATVGLYGVHATFTGVNEFVAAAAECVAVVASAVALVREHAH